MDKTIFVLLDACQYEAASKYLGYLEHMIDYNKGAKYKKCWVNCRHFQSRCMPPFLPGFLYANMV